MEQDPFALFDLTPGFELDQGQLQRRFIAATAANHPDRFTDPLQQAEAAERSAAINEAFSVLTDPQRRADCLLVLLGGPAKEDDKSLPDDLLTQMMDVRQRMEEAVADQDQAVLAELATWANRQRQAHLQRIGELFKQMQSPAKDGDRAAAGKAVRLQLNALRYFQRMIEQMP
jgi:molecular chaperone HscB